jgi:Transposase DDE domain group 1
VVAHAGSVATRMLADRTLLTAELSRALKHRSFTPVHVRGRVLVDVAVMLADGGEAISDIEVLRHQAPVLGPVASAPTVWRALDELTPAALKRVQTARARVRRHVWALLAASEGGLPVSKVAGTDLGEVVVLDVDATIVVAHSEKEQASPTFKKTFGFHPLAVWCDNSQEFLAGMLRTGKAGSNTAADHIAVLTDAITQIPAAHRKRMLVRCDGAGASHDLLDWLTAQGKVRGRSLEYSVGFPVTEKIRETIALVPQQVWTPPPTLTATSVTAGTSPSSPACWT